MVALKRELRKIQKHRGVLRANRHSGPLVALVGYTNAGKSALLNGLTGATIESQDRLFCTLDSTMRASRECVGGHRKLSFRSEKRRPLHATGTLEGLGSHVIVVDTVGFISELPTQLVAAFRSTLQQILDADVLLHVRDVSAPSFEQQKQAAPPRNERAATCILPS
eukprot:COSAG01_NODE_5486_length_4230_cov_2.267974_5_plen_166_part_00